MPHFLTYYRELGIERIFYVDNSSTDESIEILRMHEDVHVWQCASPYVEENRFGVAWQEALMKQYGKNHWCLLADMDELFQFPFQEHRSLRDFTQELDAEGANNVHALYLDMYSDRPLSQTVIVPGEPFVEVCPYLDRTWPGARGRLLDARWNAGMTKQPLVKWHNRLRFSPGFHRLSGKKVMSRTQCAALHFKYVNTMPAYVRHLIAARHGFQPAQQIYERYFDQNPDPCFYDSEVSVKYKNTDQLIRLGFLRVDGDSE